MSGGGGGETVVLSGTRGVSSGGRGGGEVVELVSEGVPAGDGDDMADEAFRRDGESEGFWLKIEREVWKEKKV